MDPIKSIGQLLKGHEQKDAIHMAIIPVIANEYIAPGSKVALVVDSADQVENAKCEGRNVKPIGVLDPFLENGVRQGDRCWLFLYPGTVTGMRHEWKHPMFKDVHHDPVKSSIAWLNTYAENCKITYEVLMSGVKEYIDLGCDGATLDDQFGDYEVTDEFWDHYQNVTGVRGTGGFWTCCI